MVSSGNRCNMSIGCRVKKDEYRNIAGHKVRFITEANLDEISAVKPGAIAHAFATLVDGVMFDSPTAGKRSAAFRTAYALHKTSVALRELQDSIDRLAARSGIASVARMERSDIRVLPSKCEATSRYFTARPRPRLPDVCHNRRHPGFRHSASRRAFTPVFDGLWTRVNAL
jgi:hypothetical protein